MSFKPNSGNSNLQSVRYSGFLGALYLATAEAEAAVAAERTRVTEEVWKRGFTDKSQASIKALRDAGVMFGKMDGALTGVRLITRDIEGGRKVDYLSVTVTADDDTKTNLSVEIGNKGAQMLIRKLVNAKPGTATVISMFATYEQKEGASRAYAEHGASLKQQDQEVKGVSPADALAPQVKAAMEALTAAGIPVDDKDTRNKRREAVELGYHVGLVKDIEAMFKTYYEASKETAQDPV